MERTKRNLFIINMLSAKLKFLIFALLMLIGFLFSPTAKAVGTSCTRNGDQIKITVNLAFWSLDSSIDIEYYKNIWTNEIRNIWNNNGNYFYTSACHNRVEFEINSITLEGYANQFDYNNSAIKQGYHSIEIKRKIEPSFCSECPALFQLSTPTYPTTKGIFSLECSAPLPELPPETNYKPKTLTNYCAPVQTKIWAFEENFKNQNCAAHEIGHAMGLHDEYMPSNEFSSCSDSDMCPIAEFTIMGFAHNDPNSALSDMPTTKQIDKIVQMFCKGTNLLCDYTPFTSPSCQPETICNTNLKCQPTQCSGSVSCTEQCTCGAPLPPGELAVSCDDLILQKGKVGTVTADVSGGKTPYTCSWSGTAQTSGNNCASASIPATLALGTYSATITVKDSTIPTPKEKSASCTVIVQEAPPPTPPPREKPTGIYSIMPECYKTGTCTICDILNTLIEIGRVILQFIGALALLFIIISGYLLMVSRGKKGRDTFKAAIIGFLIVLFAYSGTSIIISLFAGEWDWQSFLVCEELTDGGTGGCSIDICKNEFASHAIFGALDVEKAECTTDPICYSKGYAAGFHDTGICSSDQICCCKFKKPDIPLSWTDNCAEGCKYFCGGKGTPSCEPLADCMTKGILWNENLKCGGSDINSATGVCCCTCPKI